MHLIVAHEEFELLAGEGVLNSYRFGTGIAAHLFCATCGVKSFYQPRSHPHAWSVNFHCLDDGHGLESQVTQFDGQTWEEARALLD